MVIYNFDKIVDRKGSNCVKHDLNKVIFGEEDLLPMWVADMDFNTPPFIMDAISKRISHPVMGYSFKPDSYNIAIQTWLKSRLNWDVETFEISFSPGVVPGLLIALTAFTNPGDKVIVQSPVYFPFFTTIEENGRELINNPLVEKDNYYTMDFEHLKSIIDDNTKAIFICNPHNPVGRVWTKDELNELVEICYSKNIKIFSDEIHSDIIIKPNKHIPLASLSDKAAEITITFMAPSKTFNVAGLSTSFVVIQNEELFKRYDKELKAYHLYIGNIMGNVATEAAYSPEGAVWVDEMIDYISANINYVDNFIKENIPQVKMQIPEATYLLWLDMRSLNMSNDELSDFCVKKAKLGLNQGHIFGAGGNGYMRINVATSKEIVIEAMNRLKTAIDSIPNS